MPVQLLFLIFAALFSSRLPAPVVARGGVPPTAVTQRESVGRVERYPNGDRKPQWEVATKAPLGTIRPDDPAVARALDARDLEAAKKLAGKEATVIGTVDRVFVSEGNSVVVLNFDRNFRNAVSVALQPENYTKFPDVRTLTGQRLLVTGKVGDFQGRPQIELLRPEQVKIIK
jgi:hypothetical protein